MLSPEPRAPSYEPARFVVQGDDEQRSALSRWPRTGVRTDHRRDTPEIHRRDCGTADVGARRRGRPVGIAAGHAVPTRWMDGAPGRPPSGGQSYARVHKAEMGTRRG